MKKTIGLTLIVFAVSFLTSCASNGLVLPKTIPGTIKTYTVNQEGTVEILGQDIKTKPMHCSTSNAIIGAVVICVAREK